MNPHHLLDQAEQLASAGAGRPRQTDLRRATSAAYYALFHLLTQAGGQAIASPGELRRVIVRAYNHGEMKQAATVFARGVVPPALRGLLAVVPADVCLVAQAFIDLQEARHRADYDLRASGRATRAAVQGYIRQARAAFEAWDRVRGTGTGEMFLLMLLLHQKLNR